jgi:hypothetical protein
MGLPRLRLSYPTRPLEGRRRHQRPHSRPSPAVEFR